MNQSAINNQQLTVPRHVAVIMDGNRRWAKERGLPVLAGHKKVTDEILEPLIEYASTKGVRYMTFWAWSTENWERNKREVRGIMMLFRQVIKRRLEKLHKKGVRVKVIGNISKFDNDITQGLERVVEKTKNNKTITAIFALNYGGRDEIIRAIKKLGQKLSNQNGESVYNVTIKQFNSLLDTTDIPDPDIIVRTGGEQRLSGFMLWQSEYSELYFPSWYMPEFTKEKLDEVISVYQERKRRFGK